MFRLIRPTIKYEESYREPMTFLHNTSSTDYDGSLTDVKGTIRLWHERAKDPVAGYSHFWLMLKDQYLGSFGYDHKLVEEFFRAARWQIQEPNFKLRSIERDLLSLGVDQMKDNILAHLKQS